MAEIRVDNLVKRFGTFTAVRDTSFTVENGDFFCLLGPSGCGKTTTLRMVAGLELPSSGSIRLDGEDVTFKRARERDIAMVFQLFALYPHMNVRKNISFPLVSMGVPKAETRRRVEEAARRPCASSICSTSRYRGSRAAIGSGSRSGAPSCASRRPS